MGILREAVDFYRQRKREEREKKTLLSSDADFSLLEKLVQKCNNNPNLKIQVFLKDGTRLLLRSYEERKHNTSDLINGDFIDIK